MSWLRFPFSLNIKLLQKIKALPQAPKRRDLGHGREETKVGSHSNRRAGPPLSLPDHAPPNKITERQAHSPLSSMPCQLDQGLGRILLHFTNHCTFSTLQKSWAKQSSNVKDPQFTACCGRALCPEHGVVGGRCARSRARQNCGVADKM